MSSINSDESEPGIDAKNDIDARADTICLGANWRLSSASGQCCDVYGFHDDFKGIEDVTIAILATGIKISTDVCTFWFSIEHSILGKS